MTTNSTSLESKMIEEVRRWRREAYEAYQRRSPDEQTRRLGELLQKFGLPAKPTGRTDKGQRNRP